MSLPERVRSIVEEVAAERSIPYIDMVAPCPNRRSERLSHARFEAMRRIRETILICDKPATVTQIASWLNCDHTTVVHGLKVTNARPNP